MTPEAPPYRGTIATGEGQDEIKNKVAIVTGGTAV